MTYTPTVFIDDSPPGVSAVELNKLGNGVKDAHDLIAALSLGATVATTVGGLGTPTTGKIGLIRAGSGPAPGYVHLPVFADTSNADGGGKAKWVSDPLVAFVLAGGAGMAATGSSYTSVFTDNCVRHLQPWKIFDDAGLEPQFRYTAVLKSSNAAGTSYCEIGYAGLALGGNDNSGGTLLAASEKTVVGTTGKVIACDWVPIPAGYTAADFITVGAPWVKSANAAHTATVIGLTAYLRWVSK